MSSWHEEVEPPSDWTVTRTLSEKCKKMTFRNNATRMLIILSTIGIFSVLGLIFMISRGDYEMHMTSEENFEQMHFKMQCQPDFRTGVIDPASCVAVSDASRESRGGDTTLASDVLVKLLQSDTSPNKPDSLDSAFKDASNFAQVVGSMLLNGLPVLGLDDWFALSDFLNANINSHMRARLMQYTSIKGRFINLLGVRDLSLTFTPDNCWTRALINHLNKTTANFKKMKIIRFNSMHAALENGTANTWAVIDVRMRHPDDWDPKDSSDTSDDQCVGLKSRGPPDGDLDRDRSEEHRKLSGSKNKRKYNLPQLTLRMHPIAIPDTRSYRWNPVKDNAFDSLSTGQLLYYTSGFLTLQHEIQNFFTTTSIGGTEIHKRIIHESSKKFQSQMDFIGEFLNGTSNVGENATSPLAELISHVMRSRHLKYSKNAPIIDTPVFLRALSQPSYLQSKYWQRFGEIITTCLILYFCIPAALTGGSFSTELRQGQIEVLSTLPGVRVMHSALAWCLCVWHVLVFWAVATALFFYGVLWNCNVLIPTINLVLLGASLAPLASTMSVLIQRTDAIVVIIPTMVFFLMLPGLIYFDMAFDDQRTIVTELLLCLSPPSAAALVLRQMCSLEALGHTTTWHTLSPVAETPLYCYTIMLLFDLLLYFIFLIGVSELFSIGPNSGHRSADRGSAFESHDLYVTNLNKEYSVMDGSIPVLSNINVRARLGTVTTILGSNGAGKTTLMRIIAGLDVDYDGHIQYPRTVDRSLVEAALYPSEYNHRKSTTRSQPRLIGWCPQHDSLFNQLTVYEHFELFAELLGPALGGEYFDLIGGDNSRWRFSLSRRERGFNRIVNSLGLSDHRSKGAYALSGGMKRRLSLALASMGNPTLLILDEPTSGCDSHTREKVRQWILASRQRSAVMISTHHVDDIAIVSDRVWYLDDRYLRYDGALSTIQDLQYGPETGGTVNSNSSTASASPIPKSQLKSSSSGEKKSVRFSEFEVSWGQKALIFKIGTLDIYEEFKLAVSKDSRAALFWGDDTSGINLTSTQGHSSDSHLIYVTIPGHLNTFMFGFIRTLEMAKRLNWALTSPNVFKSITAAADSDLTKSGELKETIAKGPSSGSIPVQSILPGSAKPFSLFSVVGADADHIRSIVNMRWLELQSHFSFFMILNILGPFFVVLLIAMSCGGNSYPKLQLASEFPSFPHIGQVPAGSGLLKHIDSGIQSEWVLENKRSLYTTAKHGGSEKDRNKPLELVSLLNAEKSALSETFGELLTWVGDIDSNQLGGKLANEIFSHAHERWGAFVVNDKVENFFDTSVYIPAEALQMTPDEIYQYAEQAHQVVCNETNSGKDTSSTGNHKRKKYDSGWKIEKALLFCGKYASSRIGVARQYNYTTRDHDSALVITSYASLRANVTLMCNITSHHVAPIFLKEVVPAIYGALQSADQMSGDNEGGAGSGLHKYSDSPTEEVSKKEKRNVRMQSPGSPQYDLFSYPFPELNLMNQASMWRGYLGASFVLLLMLISTMVCVRFVTQLRASGVKHLSHLSGVSSSSYWIANYICDSLVVFSILITVYTAVYVGGAPLSSFYFDLPPHAGFLFLGVLSTFSLATVAGNYAFCALSSDSLTSQLSSVLSSIMIGVCLKLYIRLQKYEDYSRVSTMLTVISPSFAFTSGLFDMFSQYANNIGKSNGVLTDMNCPGLISAISFDMFVMVGQAVAYLFITIIIDMHWVRFKCYCSRCMPHAVETVFVFVGRIFGTSWSAVRTASVATVSAVESDFALRFLWSRNSDQPGEMIDKRENEYGNAAISETELTALLPPSGLARVSSDPDLVDETGEYGSMWDISPSEMRLTASDSASTAEEGRVLTSRPLPERSSHPVVNISGLCMEYPLMRTPALHSLSMSIKSGERVALVGVNGGGKSTLFRTLSSESSNIPRHGVASVEGFNVVSDAWSIFEQRLVGYVPQEGGLLGFLTVKEILQLFESFSGRRNSRVPVLEEKYMHYPVRSLSGGSKKKLSIALANMHTPKALLLDECTTGIDPEAAEKVLQYLKENLQAEQSMLFASHRVDECVAACDRIVVLCDGNIVLDGPISRFYELSSEFYLIDIGIINQKQSIPVANSYIDLLKGLLSSRLSTESKKSDLMASMLTSTVVYSPTLLRIMCRKKVVPLSCMWVLLEELSVAKRIRNYYFRDVGMEEVLSALISEAAVVLDH